MSQQSSPLPSFITLRPGRPSRNPEISSPVPGPGQVPLPTSAVQSPNPELLFRPLPQEMPITEEQHELATRFVIDLGYRDVPRPPLRTLQILKNTYDRYRAGRLTEDIASRMDGTFLKEEIQVLLRECRADEVLQDVPLTPSGQGTGSTSSYEERRNRGSRIITEIPSGVTHTDFQRQLAQTFQDTPSSSRDLRAAHEAMRDPPLAP